MRSWSQKPAFDGRLFEEMRQDAFHQQCLVAANAGPARETHGKIYNSFLLLIITVRKVPGLYSTNKLDESLIVPIQLLE